MNTKVTNFGPYALSLQYGTGVHDVLPLEVGAHTVSEEIVEAVLAHPISKRIFEAQCSVDDAQPEGTVSDPTAARGDITKLTVDAAQKLVAGCQDREQLKKWGMADARLAVRKMLHLRDRELLPGEQVGKAS